jgi:sulfite reductase (ferredoxin)
MLCPVPPADDAGREIERHARAIAERLLPCSRAYHELWLDGERVVAERAPEQDDDEPIYGRTYLPRKFKIAMGSPADNCVEVQTQDIGIVPVVESGVLAGFNVLAGGGLGMTHNKPETFPRLGDEVGFVPPERLLAVVEGIVVIHRDHGDRADRRHARLKYLLHDRGVDWLRGELEAALGFRIEPARTVPPLLPLLHLGWQPQADGRFSLGLSIENGRVRDDGSRRLRSALRAIVERFRPGVRLTPSQDVLLVGIAAADRARIDALLAEHGVPRPASLSPARLHSMACPALPTCGLALAEAERALPSVIDELEVALTEVGLGRETITVRMTGCPNGCARPYVAEIGFVGRSLDRYAVFVGGRSDASRLNKVFADLVPRDALVPTLRPLLLLYRDERRPAESFGDFCDRLGVDGLQARIAERASDRRGPQRARAALVRPRPEVRLHG